MTNMTKEHGQTSMTSVPSAPLSSEHILSEALFPQVCECEPQSEPHSPLCEDVGPWSQRCSSYKESHLVGLCSNIFINQEQQRRYGWRKTFLKKAKKLSFSTWHSKVGHGYKEILMHNKGIFLSHSKSTDVHLKHDCTCSSLCVVSQTRSAP